MLELSDKPVSLIMTPSSSTPWPHLTLADRFRGVEDIYSLSSDSILNQDKVDEVRWLWDRFAG